GVASGVSSGQRGGRRRARRFVPGPRWSWEGLLPSSGVAPSGVGAGVPAVRFPACVRTVVPPRPGPGRVVDDARAGGEAAEGEVPVLAAPMTADGAAGRRGVEADLLGEAGTHQ